MATLSHAESRRLYSWWWDSHISPKNSKWLQENLTDMDTKVKAMIKLIEEDADSFARRAEMYYKKRPELMKLVEEFYRAYRALAERYDHATGALRQAHRTIAEAFPNQVPLALNDDSPTGSSIAESEPHTPEMPHSIRALFDPDDLQKDTMGVPLHFQATKRNGAHIEDVDGVTGKKGLKQLNGIFSSGNGTDSANFAEGRVRKGLKFQEQEKKGSECTLQDVSRDIQKYTLEETDTDRKLRDLLDEFCQLSTENQNLKVKVLSESERAEKAEKIVESLQQSLSKLKSEKEAAFLLYQQCLERVSSLEDEISRGQADISRLNGEILEGTSRVQAAEERFLLSEKENQSLQSEVDILVQKTTVQQRELEKKNEELEKLRICIQDGRIHLMRAEATLQSLKSLHSHLLEEQRILQLELKHGIQMLKDMEFMKQCLEDEIRRLKEENLVLNERHKSSAMSIKNLQDEIYSLKEVKVKLEEEVGLHVDQGDALRQELYCLREKLNDLDRRHQDVTEQVEAVGLNVNCLQSSVKDLQEENLKLKQSCEDIEHEKAILSSSAKNLQDENLKLKEIYETKEHDKAILSEKLENMEKLLVKNALLENSLSDASAELEGLRGKIKMLEQSFELHLREKSTLATEKGILVSQMESITKNIEKLLEKNSVLENSLSGANVELEGMRAKSKGLEASCQALQDEKSSLLFVIDSMVSQVETIKKCLENLERRHAELENKHSCLEKERESALHNIDKLQLSLNLREQEHETYIQSSQIQLATLGSQIHVLQEEAQSRKIEFEEEQSKLINSEVEIFVLQRSIYDIKDRSSMLEDTLTDVNVELDGLRVKSKSLEESCQVLQDEKVILLLEINNMVSQVESIKQCLENLEKRHADLEDRHSCLEKEKESALHNIDELQLSLNLRKEEHETYIQSSQVQLATLGSHIHVLQHEAQLRKRQFEEEQDKFMNSDVEIFVLQRYICDMRERNSMLENSLSDVNIEVERLREKCKSLEESCQFLQDEELSHLLEIENMVCQVESIKQCLENSEERHAELEDKHMHLEKERESALHHIDELQLELSTRKQEQETYLLSSQAQLATLESQIYLLQEEADLRKRQFEEVQDKFMYAEFEIVVLRRCIHDMKESNLLLSIECKEQIKASMHAKKLILELEEENLGQQMNVKSLMENNEKLRTGIHHVLKSLGIDADDGCCDITIREFFPLILGKIKDMQCSVLDTEDEKQQLLFEKVVSDTLLEQLQLDASDLKSDKHALERESVIRSNELLMLQREKRELLETSDQLKQGVHEGQRRVGILMGDVEILQGKLSDSQEAYQKLQDENYTQRDENQSLKKEIYDLKEEKYMVEEENRNLSMIFKSICSEKAMEIETLSNELDHLHGVDSELEQVRIVVKKAEAENLRLKDSIAELKKFKTDSMILEDELNMERNVSEQLNREVENGKELLNKKEKELSEAIQKIQGIQNESAALHKEISELKFTKEQLDSELQEKTNMVEQSEMEAAAFYEDLQTNAIFLALFKEKAFELVGSCRSLEEYSIIQNKMFSDERDSRNAANEELKIKLGVLERENGALKDELTAYLPLTLSLKDSISSLEELTLTLAKLHANYPETKDAAAVSSHHDVIHQELGEADDAKALAGVTELQKLQTWIQAMEKAMMEMGRLTMQASSNTNARLEAAMKEIEELKSKNSLLQNEAVQNNKGVILQQGDEKEPSKNVEAQNNEAEASRAKRELVMKDIQLDHVSDSLSHENGVDSFRICKKGKSESDDQMLELWETAEQDTRRKRSTKRRTKKPTSTTSFDAVEYQLIKVVEKQKNEYSSSELQSEKELSVDKSEVPEKICVSQDDGNKRVLERLASDAQRLTNLQINAQELKRKFEKSEKANQLLGFEYESVKVQLKEVVEAILQLIDVNSKLTKNVKDGSASSGSKGKLEEMGNMRMRQVSERARRWSEQIGTLELEVQRIQFVMVKVENEYGNKGTKAFNRQTGVVLRDYIYGGKGRRRWKKSHCCCACMRPSTKCD